MLLKLSERQIWRLLRAYREEGVRALIQGNRGRRPVHATPEEVKARIVERARGAYDGANYAHMVDLLDERDEVTLSRWTVRRIVQAAGIRSPRRRRPPQHRRRWS